MSPTPKQYLAFQALFDYFDTALFGNELPEVILTFSRSNRFKGYFSMNRWKDQKGNELHEICLNAGFCSENSLKEICSTLVHEMAHLWQHEFGAPSRGRYHNREWADKMQDLGLMPSNTGLPGGKRVGQRMTHYIIPEGKFDMAYEMMNDGRKFPFTTAEIRGEIPGVSLMDLKNKEGLTAIDLSKYLRKNKKNKKNKVKFSCKCCGANAWGKPILHIVCGECKERMESSIFI